MSCVLFIQELYWATGLSDPLFRLSIFVLTTGLDSYEAERVYRVVAQFEREVSGYIRIGNVDSRLYI